ncbi:hypothetical protein GQR58_016413 [Nymphon striatum]|nr:hypothetical protein GQR58_016413 [Nymphon striatum]
MEVLDVKDVKDSRDTVTTAFSSKIPRFNPNLYHAGNYSVNGLPHANNTQLKKSLSHFNTKEPYENIQKRRSEPDILSSTGDKLFTDKINVTWSSHCIGFKSNYVSSSKEFTDEKSAAGVSGEGKIKREDLSLTHLPCFHSDMEDDNASIDSLGILTPSQMKDFLEDEVVPDLNVIEVIDINGHKIECKLHYEDMQWSSPFLNLSGDHDNVKIGQHSLFPINSDEALTPINIGDKVEEAAQKVEQSVIEATLVSQSLCEASADKCEYITDNESEICLNNQQIIEMIQLATSKQDKRILSVVPLSESGYNADNESDILSDVSASPTEEKYLVPKSHADVSQRESVTDSGFYSETRGSFIVGSESDFDEAPHVKRARNAQVIDGMLYYNQQNVKQLNENSTESNRVDSLEVLPLENEYPDHENMHEMPAEKDLDKTITCDNSQEDFVSDTMKQAKEIILPETDKPSQVCENTKNIPKSFKTSSTQRSESKRPHVMSKAKRMGDDKTVENLSADSKLVRKPAALKKNRWDSITSKIAASLADEKKNPKQKEVKSKIDNKSPSVTPTNDSKTDSKSPVPTASNKTQKASTKATSSINKAKLSSKSQPTNRTVNKSSLSQKENRPSSARSNYSENSKQTSTLDNKKKKLVRKGVVKSVEAKNQTKSSSKSLKSSHESISSFSKANDNNELPASRSHMPANCSKTKKSKALKETIATKSAIKKHVQSTSQTEFSDSGDHSTETSNPTLLLLVKWVLVWADGMTLLYTGSPLAYQ